MSEKNIGIDKNNIINIEFPYLSDLFVYNIIKIIQIIGNYYQMHKYFTICVFKIITKRY